MSARAAAAACAALLLLGCATPPPAPVPRAPPPAASSPAIQFPARFAQEGVEVTVDGLWVDGYGNVVGVSGIARNISLRDLAGCMISLDVNDSSGVKVSTAIASTTGLRVNQSWRFQASLTTPFRTTFRSISRGTVTVIPAR